jgi:hypothetical protein
MRWAENITRTRKGESLEDFIRKPRRKKTLGRNRRIWDNNSGINLENIKQDNVDWIDFVENMDRRKALVKIRLP